MSKTITDSAFSWSMRDSLLLAKEILQRHTHNSLKRWNNTADRYLRAKARLLKAINPDNDSGRVTFNVNVFDSAVCANEINATIVGIFGPRLRNQSVTASWYSCLVTSRDVTDGVLSSSSNMTCLHNEDGKPYVRAGVKLTKAIQTFLAKVLGNKSSKEEIDETTTAIGAIIARHKINMKFCISANPVDLLLMSTHCTFSSCHRLEGEYRGAALQYFNDEHTAVAFGWREVKKPDAGRMCGVDAVLPYKRWRQTVHFNLPKSSAFFIRQYSDMGILQDDAHLKIREQAAKILARDKGISLEEIDWVKSEKFKDEPAIEYDEEEDVRLAYIDNPINSNGSYKIRLSGGLYRAMYLAESVGCPACSGYISKAGLLVCSKCVDKVDLECSHCGCYTGEEREFVNSNTLCKSCFADCTAVCGECGERDVTSRMVGCSCDKTATTTYYCHTRCSEKRLKICTMCGVFKMKEHVEGSGFKDVCPDCVANLKSQCDNCKIEGIMHKSLSERTVNGKTLTLCRPCHITLVRLAEEEATKKRKDLARKREKDRLAELMARQAASGESNSIPPPPTSASSSTVEVAIDIDTSDTEAEAHEMPF